MTLETLINRQVQLSGIGFNNLHLVSNQVPEISDDEILCRVDATGVCTSNLKLIAQGSAHSLINGWDITKFPLTLGEEASLTVVKVGKNLSSKYFVNQRLGIQPAVDLTPITFPERYNDSAQFMTKAAVGYTLSGMLADYFIPPQEVIKGDCLIPLPNQEMSYFEVAISEPIACVHKSQEQHVHLVKESPTHPRRAEIGILAGGTTVVIGAGTIGRMHIEMAMRFKPKNIIVSAKSEAAQKVKDTLLEKSKKLNINLIIVDPNNLKDKIYQVAPNGADDIIVAVGNQSIQQDSLSWLNRSGVINFFGGLPKGSHILKLDSLDVHYRETKIVGSSGGDPWDLQNTLKLIAEKQIDVGNYVYGIGSLQHAIPIMEEMQKSKINGRAILYPHLNIKEFQLVDYFDKDLEDKLYEQYRSS